MVLQNVVFGVVLYKVTNCISDILRRPVLSRCLLAAYVPLPAEDSANV